MGGVRDSQLDGKCRHQLVGDIDESEHNQERCANACHKMWRVEDVKHLEYPYADQCVDQEDAENVSTSDLDHTRTQFANAE